MSLLLLFKSDTSGTVSGSFTANGILLRAESATFTANAVLKRTVGVFVEDRFTRTVTDGLGSADVGGKWSILGGSDADWDVNGSVATIVNHVTNTNHFAVAEVDAKNLTAKVSFTPSVDPTPGQSLEVSLNVRRLATGADKMYRIQLKSSEPSVAPNLRVLIHRYDVGAGEASILGDTDTGVANGSGTVHYKVAVWNNSSNEVEFRIKVWKDAAPEPSSWNVSAKDSAPQADHLLGGPVQIQTFAISSYNPTISIDNVEIYDLDTTFTADALLRTTTAVAFTANSILRREESATFTANAVLLRTESATFVADAVLAAATGTVSETFTSDAVLKATVAATFTADALLSTLVSESFTANAVILKTESFTVSADSYIDVIGVPVWTTPADTVTVNDLTPTLEFNMPSETSGDMHFKIEMDTVNTFNSGNYVVFTSYSGAGWEYWNGSIWVAITESGVPSSFKGNAARYTLQTPLVAGTWYRRVTGGV